MIPPRRPEAIPRMCAIVDQVGGFDGAPCCGWRSSSDQTDQAVACGPVLHRETVCDFADCGFSQLVPGAEAVSLDALLNGGSNIVDPEYRSEAEQGEGRQEVRCGWFGSSAPIMAGRATRKVSVRTCSVVVKGATLWGCPDEDEGDYPRMKITLYSLAVAAAYTTETSLHGSEAEVAAQLRESFDNDGYLDNVADRDLHEVITEQLCGVFRVQTHEVEVPDPKIEVEEIIIGDPDRGSETTVYVNGVSLADCPNIAWDEYHIDPGAGFTWDDWVESRGSDIAAAKTPAVAARLYELAVNPASDFIDGYPRSEAKRRRDFDRMIERERTELAKRYRIVNLKGNVMADNLGRDEVTAWVWSRGREGHMGWEFAGWVRADNTIRQIGEVVARVELMKDGSIGDESREA